MGGSNRPCTLDDFLGFLESYYPQNSQLVIQLEQQRKALGDPKPVSKQNPHVLYLPAKRVT